ncbi:arsenate reductase [Halolamina pelagica]|uniref:Arsenate reductase n=1 Tax=Halolamina pelagica TaxID=699431 RepID=A0A0N8I051_9EURY|nr:ArsC family transcriptional regulator [Halolamina pelagica]KPN31331.1 arsenate reductase [Halolamina pelagica]
MTDEPADTTTIAFVCVQNAGRSQMAYAFAQRERERQGLRGEIALVTGGTRPADQVHPAVVDAMDDIGIDITDRTPREVGVDDLRESEYVITMGCSAADVCPAGWGGESRDWDLDDPDDQPPATVARIRDEIERRVGALFDEVAAD